MPGQKVLAKITKKRREYAQAKLLEIIENVDYAIKNKCPHFGQCGGCSTQYIPYEKQLEIKEEQLLKLFKNKDIEDFEFLGVEKVQKNMNTEIRWSLPLETWKRVEILL